MSDDIYDWAQEEKKKLDILEKKSIPDMTAEEKALYDKWGPESENYQKAVEKKNQKIQEKIDNQFQNFDLNKNIDLVEDFVNHLLKLNPLYYDSARIWYSWDKKEQRYKIIDKNDVVNLGKSIFQAQGLNTNNIRNSFLNAITDRARLNKPQELSKKQIQFKNKLIDVTTDEQQKISSDVFAFNPIPWELSDSEETPTIDRIFKQWVGEDYIKLQELCAYCMLPDYPFARFWVLLGSGANGKSTFFDFLNKFLGKHNICSSDLELLFNNRFETANLYKKLSCIIGESDYGSIKNTRKLKTLTGNDPNIRYEFKNRDTFSGKNYAKIIIATNQLPETGDKTTGYYRRFICIKFPNQFKEKYDILGQIPEKEFSNFATKCLRILKELLQKGEFSREGDIEQKTQEYERLSNPFLTFKEERMREKRNSILLTNELYEAYKVFLHEKGFNRIGYREFTTLLHSSGIETTRKNLYFDTRYQKYYLTTEDIPNYDSSLFSKGIVHQEKKTFIQGYVLGHNSTLRTDTFTHPPYTENRMGTPVLSVLNCPKDFESNTDNATNILNFIREKGSASLQDLKEKFSSEAIGEISTLLERGDVFVNPDKKYQVIK